MLALLLGGPGCFYIDPWRGTKATLASLLALFYTLTGPLFSASIFASILPVHAAPALESLAKLQESQNRGKRSTQSHCALAGDTRKWDRNNGA